MLANDLTGVLDEHKSREQLIYELTEMRSRLAFMEQHCKEMHRELMHFRDKDSHEGKQHLHRAQKDSLVDVHDYDRVNGKTRWVGRIWATWSPGFDEPLTHEVFIRAAPPEDRTVIRSALGKPLKPSGNGQCDIEFGVTRCSDHIECRFGANSRIYFEYDRAVHLFGGVPDITPPTKTESELWENEKKYRDLFEYSPNFLVETDWTEVHQYIKGLKVCRGYDAGLYFQDHPEDIRQCLRRVKIKAFNKASSELFEDSEEKATDRNLESLVAGESYDIWARHLAALIQGATAYCEELCLIMKGKRKKRVLYFFQVVPGYEDSLETVILSFVDITERKRCEEELAKAYRLLESITDATHFMLAGLDRRFNFLRVNKAFAEAGQKYPADYIGKNFFEIYPSAENESIFQKVLETGKPFAVRAKPFLPPDQPGCGDSYWDWQLKPLLDVRGNVEMMILELSDVTASEKTRKRQRESEARLRALIENLPVEFWAMDTDSRYIMENPVCKALRGDCIGKRPQDVAPDPSTLQHWQANNRRAFAGEVVTEEVSYVHRGETRALYNLVAPFRVDNEIRGILGINVDITERKKAEEALQRLNSTLEKRVAEHTQLAEARAKQLQALTVQLIEAEEQERQRIAQLLHDDLQQILASAKLQLQTACHDLPAHCLLESVDQLLVESIRKARSMSHELSPSILQHSGFIPALKWLILKLNEQFGLDVQLKAEAEYKIQDRTMKVFMFRAAQELLFNITKHAETEAAVVSVSASNGKLVIKVADHGKGFNPDIVCFSNLNNGLGLLSIRERARAIGGDLAVVSSPGHGSCFTLNVPFHKDSEPCFDGSNRRSANHPNASPSRWG